MMPPSVLFEDPQGDDDVEMLSAVASRLSSCRYEPERINPCFSRSKKNTRVIAANVLRSIDEIWCPCLSLHHEHVGSDGEGDLPPQSEHPRTRSSAEKHATALLARPLCVRIDHSGGKTEHHEPEELLDNIYKSFALLVESRIRAYATLIARHTQQKQQQQQHGEASLSKQEVINNCLNRLFLISSAIYAERRETRFEFMHDEDLVMLDDEDVSTNGAKSSSSQGHRCHSLTLCVSFDLVMPRSAGEKKVVPIAVEAPGQIHVVECSASKRKQVRVELNVHDLLHGLMELAADVVTVVSEIASSPGVKPSSVPMARSASFLAMPPPKKRSGQQQDDNQRHALGLELLCKAASELPIVSPEMWGHRDVPSADQGQRAIPILQLGTPALLSSEDDNEDFSPDQCAEMVDSILGDLDDSIFDPRCCKKLRVGAAVL